LGTQSDALPKWGPRYNAAPGQHLPIAVNTGRRWITVGRWGFKKHWDKEKGTGLINARAETVAEKPMFRDAFARRRCLVLADSFFEWRRTVQGKTPYRILLKSGEPFTFAGVWTRGADGAITFAIITTEANELVAKIHYRMPVIMVESDERAWLEDWLSVKEANSMLRPYDAAGIL
jgi:putative SOS response-associated peptidase YedK